jgi:hypothetical protein
MCLSLRVQGVFCDEGSPADGGQLPFFGFAHVQLFFAKIFLRMVSGINTSKLRKNSSSKKEL